MQKTFQPITPQKKNFSLFPIHDQFFFRQLSPMALTLNFSNDKKVKLQMLQSPAPTAKDLFAQLIASQQKASQEDHFQDYEILEEESYDIDDLNIRNSRQESESLEFQPSEDYEEENGLKKRKRKSTAQLKVLKVEFENESNWSKEKIVEMSENTGLSQSQVYKWWWDQKKKTTKYEKETHSRLGAKKKLIRKDYSKRGYEIDSENQCQVEDEQQEIYTKEKAVTHFEEHPDTEKKINKRLHFS